MLNSNQSDFYTWSDLLSIMQKLRSPSGCPWDIQQTHDSIKTNIIEECYEVVDAIETNDMTALQEELGDVLLQVVFHSQIASESENFSIEAVINELCVKLVQRHPHVFSDTDLLKVDGLDEVLQNWEKIKQQTKGQQDPIDSLLAVPKHFPALMKAEKLIKRARKAELPLHYLDSIDESSEFGKQLFKLVAQNPEISAELALQKECEKFIQSVTN